MPILRLSERDLETRQGTTAFDALQRREVSAVAILGATYKTHVDKTGKISVSFPWLDRLGLFTPDRQTELGGTCYMPDMPAHIDPHPASSLKSHLTTRGRAMAHFALDFPADALDDHNEVLSTAQQIKTDAIQLQTGDAICFYGSTTLHQFSSVGEVPRESVINSYAPASEKNTT